MLKGIYLIWGSNIFRGRVLKGIYLIWGSNIFRGRGGGEHGDLCDRVGEGGGPLLIEKGKRGLKRRGDIGE